MRPLIHRPRLSRPFVVALFLLLLVISANGASARPVKHSRVDRTAPTAPNLTVSASGPTSLALAWTASRDNIGVAGYHVYLSGRLIATLAVRKYQIAKLACSHSFAVAVDAFDRAGNLSPKTRRTAATAACPAVPPAPAPAPAPTSPPVPPLPPPLPPITPPAGGTGPSASSANVAVSPAGNDATCARATTPAAVGSLSPCQHLDRAYRLAKPGDTVAVLGGSYTADYPSEGAVKIRTDSAKTSSANVVFVCGDADPVTFASPADQLVITAQHVTISGACFRLNRLWVGDGPNGVSTSDVTVNGVTMWSFNIAGSSNVTISNSQVGPDVACYAPGQAASCRNDAATNEAYWFQAGRGNTDYVEPMIHTIGSTNPVNVQLVNDRFVKLQTRDSSAMHMSCLWLGWTPGGSVAIRGTSFDGCATDDIHVDTPSSSNLTLDGNTLHHSVEPVQTGSNWSQETDTSQTELQVKCQDGMNLAGYTITNNLFEHGWDLNFGGCSSPSFTSLVSFGNTGGVIRNPG